MTAEPPRVFYLTNFKYDLNLFQIFLDEKWLWSSFFFYQWLSNFLNMNTEQVSHANHWPKNSLKFTASLADPNSCIPTTHLLGFGFFSKTMHAFILEKQNDRNL